MPGVDPAAEVAADEEGARRSRRTPPAWASSAGNGVAERDLVDARPVDRAGDGEERRAGLVGGARGPEPVGAEPRDQRDVRQGLDVLDKGRARRRLRARTAAAA